MEVQNGCDHRCTFCIIPFGRGNSRSVEAGEVVRRVRALAEQGFNEVVLTGVDMTAWGQDFVDKPMLGELVARILKDVPALPRLRLSSIDAAEIDPVLLRCLADEPRLMPYLHLSLQHGDDMILKRMKRRHGRADALRLIDSVRRVRPDVAFGCDLIAGFPPRPRRCSRTPSASWPTRASPSSTPSPSAPAPARPLSGCRSSTAPWSGIGPSGCARRAPRLWTATWIGRPVAPSRPSSRSPAWAGGGFH